MVVSDLTGDMAVKVVKAVLVEQKQVETVLLPEVNYFLLVIHNN